MPEISCGAAGVWGAFALSRRCIGRFFRHRAFCWSVICAVGLVTSGWNSREAGANSDEEFFEAKIRPLLVDRCYGCHSADSGKRHGELALDTKQGWEIGGDSGPAIIPGDAAASLLFRAVQYTDSHLQMPPEEAGGKLSDSEIALLREWINRGAWDPRVAQLKVAGMDAAEAKSWWAFQPVRKPTEDKHIGIDTILDQQLDIADLTKAPVADKRTLLRRATFDLIGLPPTPDELADYLADESPAAFDRVIDRLLASPHYGERWGRHWLDVARYADSFDARGYGGTGDIAEAWRYRDWVVSALNSDLPYDRFIRDQIAGDILGTRKDSYDAAQITATGAYAIGNWGNGDADKKKIHTDIVDDQIDFTSRAFLGITLACARCHDHKFDPFTTRDYHAMAGFFYSSRILENFTPPGAGEEPLRIDLMTPAELSQQAVRQQRISEIDASLQAMLRPLRTVERDILGTPGLWRRIEQGTDAPSVVVNKTDTDVHVLTFGVPRRGIALQPSGTSPIAAVWQSPSAGTVTVSLRLSDTDPSCGDGVSWELRHKTLTLGSGSIANGGSLEFSKDNIRIQEGELIRLVIRAPADHACDTTATEFEIVSQDQASGTAEMHWNLRESIVAGRSPGEDGWWVCAGDGEQLIDNDPSGQSLQAERAMLVAKAVVPPKAVGLAEGGIRNTSYTGFHNARIHKRGLYDQLGDEVQRNIPALLATAPLAITEGSGRLELANWIAGPANPLTARVMVNRIWQHHFGRGLVRTPNNFGKLGQSPTHPELLDWLAWKFMESGWSIKQMHRLIMSSDAYQRSSAVDLEGRVKDSDNVFLGHQNRRRLSAEELRDALLVVAGRVDFARGGPAVRELSVPRRTLYLATVRSDRSGFQAMFDGANTQAMVDVRTDSVVAPQALWLMNSDFALAQVQGLASILVNQRGDRSERLVWLTNRLFQRQPTQQEEFLVDRVVTDATSVASWEHLCHVFLCTNEFIYVD
ncbi:MAG: PSD1 and planctomycete cytochrome C domain-containing protein [Planctomycetota bacterium]|nr:PSD1 and planctomycete cytochrome C domain-containing protein [Planctomycetota bacterium]